VTALGPLAARPEVRAVLDLLTAWIESQRAYSGLPALSIGIVHDQELVWAEGFGEADPARHAPATPDTLYRIASITKLFTATSILQLRDAGALQLDDPVTRHLPWFAVPSQHADAPPITIRHLITHTSGLPREAAFPYWTEGEFPTLERLREGLARQEAVIPTETRWKYSNLALALAGEVVAAASGKPYADYVAGHVLRPLGMTSTLVGSPDPADARLARGFARRLPDGSRAAAPFTDTRGITAAANMTTSVRDLARFAMLQFRDGAAGGAQILRGSTLREMHRVHWLEADWQAGWGLGFRVMRVGGKTLVGHGGALRGYRTLLQICPADKLAVIALTSADDGNPTLFVERALAWLAPVLARAAPRERRVADPEWRRYAGRYRSGWRDMQVLLMDDGLLVIDPTLPDPMLAPTRLVFASEHTFRAEDTDGYASHGEPVVFELDAAGRARRMRVGENYLDAVDAW
jgi:CubicO group peptidase (beta-lactamase class C family)